MADRVRIQAIVENNPETWVDVGPDGISLPVDVKDSVLPDGASTSENQTNGSQKTQIVETIPTDSTKLNPSMVISITTQETATITTLTKTIGSDQYRKIISENGSVISMSAWQKL